MLFRYLFSWMMYYNIGHRLCVFEVTFHMGSFGKLQVVHEFGRVRTDRFSQTLKRINIDVLEAKE